MENQEPVISSKESLKKAFEDELVASMKAIKQEPAMYVSQDFLDAFNQKHNNYDPEVKETAAKLGITPARLEAARDYAKRLVKQDPKMKQSTVRKKVAEKFKIKLV